MARVKAKDPAAVLIDTLKNAITDGVMKDLCLEVAAPIKMQAKLAKNGQYRTVSVSRGEELMPSGVRLGAKGEAKIIFEFKPVDPGDYEQYELDDAKVWTAFPDLESLVIRALDIEAVNTDGESVRFAQVKPQFLNAAREKEEIRVETEKADAERKVKNHYEDHPLFGVWG